MLSDKFILEQRLGVGATAEVYAAVDRQSGTRRALKIFSPLVLEDADTVRRIQTEAEALRKLRHANIVQLHGTHHGAGEFALELELLDGSDLRRWRKEYKLRLLEPLLWILSQIARGVACAHEHGILHRDLKPENILIGRKGEVKLTDFGLARQLDTITMTKSGLLAGSMGYMAPEMINGERSTAQADIFSFGAIAYELLAGENPFAGPNPQSVLKKVLTGQHKPLREVVPGVPPPVADLIERALSPNPALRPPSIWHVEAELMTMLSRSPLHKLCQSLVSPEERHKAAEAAFREKRREFEERRSRIEAGTRELAIALAMEWSFVFPDAEEPAAILASLPSPVKKAPWLAWSAAGAAALACLLLLAFFWYSRREEASLPPPVSYPPATASAPVTPAVPKPAAPARGWLQVEAEDDVRVYVDGSEIPRSQWKRISVVAGKRTLRLVKDGFLPIENVIDVRPRKVAVVKAKGASG